MPPLPQLASFYNIEQIITVVYSFKLTDSFIDIICALLGDHTMLATTYEHQLKHCYVSDRFFLLHVTIQGISEYNADGLYTKGFKNCAYQLYAILFLKKRCINSE